MACAMILSSFLRGDDFAMMGAAIGAKYRETRGGP
jgi:hypothetical protein